MTSSRIESRGKNLRVLAQPAFKNASANPYNALLYTAISELGIEVGEYSKEAVKSAPWDIWHVHWPEVFINKEGLSFRKVRRLSKKRLALLEHARECGTKIIWTIHNCKTHEGYYPIVERLFWRSFVKKVDGVISLSHCGLRLACEKHSRLKEIPSFVIPHGHYRDAYPQFLTASEARRTLSIPKRANVVAYLGMIRKYKNVEQLVRVFRELPDPNAFLLVCGNPRRDDYEKAVRAAAENDARIRLQLRFIEDDEIQLILKSADLVVFPYKDILHSGSAMLALSFDRPILVPGLGAMTELRDSVGGDWVRTYDGKLSARILQDALRWTKSEDRGVRAPLNQFDWSGIAEQTAEVYRGIAFGHSS